MAIKYKEGDFRQGYLYQVTEDIEIAYKLEGKFTNKEISPIRKLIIPKGEILEKLNEVIEVVNKLVKNSSQ